MPGAGPPIRTIVPGYQYTCLTVWHARHVCRAAAADVSAAAAADQLAHAQAMAADAEAAAKAASAGWRERVWAAEEQVHAMQVVQRDKCMSSLFCFLLLCYTQTTSMSRAIPAGTSCRLH
jgi:hypothetical protein